MEKAATTISVKSWHYLLIKWMFRENAPTPQNMHNLCPYFWLLLFTLGATLIVAPVRLFISIGNYIGKKLSDFSFNYLVKPTAISWEQKLTDLDVYSMYRYQERLPKNYKKVFGEVSSDNFVFEWFEKVYKTPVFKKLGDYPYGGRYNMEYSKEFAKWLTLQETESRKIEDEVREYRKQKEAEKVRYEEKMSKFRDGIDSFFDKTRSTILSFKNIIKWTKRVVGLIITGIGLVATYFIVNFLGRGVLWLVDNWNWEVVIIGLIVLAGIGVFILFIWLFGLWIKYIQEKGLKLWYAKIVYYTVFYLIYMPIKIVFYHFVWQLILVNLWYIISKSASLIWGGFLGFLGIFGEYFGASYTDYCPGINWVDEDKE